jgi:hypothetical protein
MRHPTGMSIACRCRGHSNSVKSSLRDAGLGGLSFVSDGLFAGGDLLDLSFSARMTTARFSAVVAWRYDLGEGKTARHAYGVRFCNPDAFTRVRFLEQVCHIEAYRKIQGTQCGRHLSSNQAAAEWIAKYADRFAVTT